MKDRATFSAFVSLFTSAGTLVCCALPALFVTLGLGAALAGLVNAVPQLVWFTEHKAYFFAFAGIMLAASAWLQWKNRNAPCPVDPRAAAACMTLRRRSKIILGVSIAIYLAGFYFAFIAEYFV